MTLAAMDGNRVREQEQFECFGIPLHVCVQGDVDALPTPLVAWGRRNWALLESPLLGPETMPSPPLPASFEVDIVR